ncbi:MAG: cytochrome c [Bryobacteraceae bacterium]|nr:cytochrome c [Bryobacteraceae bacterium]
MRWYWLGMLGPLWGHDIVTTKITWAREISRLVNQRCASCHRPGGGAPFALLTYEQARPWARSMAEEVLERRMPPWNPVKGFGEFKHEAGLNQEEISLLADWVEGGAPRGKDRYLPPAPVFPAPPALLSRPRLAITDQQLLAQTVTARGIAVVRLREGASVSAWAELPDGAAEPLLEIAAFRQVANQPLEFLRPLRLPAGTRLHISGTAALALISSGGPPARQSGLSAPRPPAAPAAKHDGRPGAGRSR